MQRLQDIYNTVIQMVSDRGYDVTERSNLVNAGYDVFSDAVENFMNEDNKNKNPYKFLSHRYLSADGEKRVMLVYYGGSTSKSTKKISVDTATFFVNECNKTKAYEAIFIVNMDLSPHANNKLTDVINTRIQVFHESDLTFNPTLHVDVPKHELLSPEEARAVLESMKVDPSKLLLIRQSDPIVRYYGWAPGGIVRIYRDDSSISILSQKSINYRKIVP